MFKIYKKSLEIFTSPEFKQVQDKGAHSQRVLWGSTSTKNPAYSDIKYVTELIARDTVNTMPEKTFEAFLDHGVVKEALTSDISNALDIVNSLEAFGININEVLTKLLHDGVASFEKSFVSLLDSIEEKTKSVCKK
jgi:transaldolase